jgi:hypothetical protein
MRSIDGEAIAGYSAATVWLRFGSTQLGRGKWQV